MPRFKTQFGWVEFKTKTKRPAKSKKSKAKAKAKPMSKKVGRWRVELKGRTVYAAGAKHGYKDQAAAKGAYKRLTSVKSVENFVKRYGTKKTCAAVCGTGSKGPAKKTHKKAASKGRRRKNPSCGSRTNAPISRAEAAKINRILRRHGYR